MMTAAVDVTASLLHPAFAAICFITTGPPCQAWTEARMPVFPRGAQRSPPPGAMSPEGGRTAAADPSELLMLRSIFKGIPSNPEPAVLSNALGRYAGFLAHTQDARVNLAEEFFQSSLSVSTERPDPRAVHSYKWFLCSHKRDFRHVTPYECLRARVPVRDQDPAALLAELGPVGSVQPTDTLASLANFLDELCLCRAEAVILWGEVFRRAREDAEPMPMFTQAKYAAFLMRHYPQRADEARGLFAVALAAEPDNIEGMVDYAALLTATPALLAQDDKVAAADEWFRKALAKAPDDPRVLSMYAAFLAGTHGLRDVDKADTLHRRAVTNAGMCAGALGRYAEFLETSGSDVEGASELFRRCHEADSLNLVGLLGLAAMKHRAHDTEAGERLYRAAVQAHPDDANALGALGSFLFHVRHECDEASALLRRAVAGDAGHAANLGQLALVLSEGSSAERAEAGDYYERAIALEPTNIRALGRLAVYHERIMADAAAADSVYRRAIQLARNAGATPAGRGGGGKGEEDGPDPYLATLLANYSALVASTG